MALNANTHWDANTQQVTITSNGSQQVATGGGAQGSTQPTTTTTTTQVPEPTITPDGGTFTTLIGNVIIGNIPSGDTAYFTTDGSNPETSSTRITYNSNSEPPVNQSETVNVAIEDQYGNWSSVLTATFYCDCPR
jgi:hypothetical protein